MQKPELESVYEPVAVSPATFSVAEVLAVQLSLGLLTVKECDALIVQVVASIDTGDPSAANAATSFPLGACFTWSQGGVAGFVQNPLLLGSPYVSFHAPVGSQVASAFAPVSTPRHATPASQIVTLPDHVHSSEGLHGDPATGQGPGGAPPLPPQLPPVDSVAHANVPLVVHEQTVLVSQLFA